MAWQFDVASGSTRRWRWMYTDDVSGTLLQQSQSAFETLYACIKDATEHGYVAPTTAYDQAVGRDLLK